MQPNIETRIVSSKGTIHKKTVTINGKTYGMTTTTRLVSKSSKASPSSFAKLAQNVAAAKKR